MQVRAERAKGDFLTYDSKTEVLQLPREKLSLNKHQIVEFRILQECVPQKPGTISLLPSRLTGGNGPAVLQLVYNNPNPKTVTLLRAYGSNMFKDVITALNETGIAEVVVVGQQLERGNRNALQ
ncbi:hypothetical protein [Pedosphaera parvula]|uniref:Uncharacterized protein n=1 Tax=Pedosphaera parvula (strain Ellin514) TaxID=320771 RepID=B9XCB7_PEDPL|nr:hypothetical protein [Pedosphaera parvula]EEF62585.1 hypothetical protein Cflav_PD5220 [Pedosphaera parvula Ellin514]